MSQSSLLGYTTNEYSQFVTSILRHKHESAELRLFREAFWLEATSENRTDGTIDGGMNGLFCLDTVTASFRYIFNYLYKDLLTFIELLQCEGYSF